MVPVFAHLSSSGSTGGQAMADPSSTPLTPRADTSRGDTAGRVDVGGDSAVAAQVEGRAGFRDQNLCSSIDFIKASDDGAAMN